MSTELSCSSTGALSLTQTLSISSPRASLRGETVKKDSEKLTVLPTVVEVPLKTTVQKAGLSLETEIVQAKVTKASKDCKIILLC